MLSILFSLVLNFSRVSAAANEINCLVQPVEACCQYWRDPAESKSVFFKGAGQNCVIVRGIDTPPRQPRTGGPDIEGGPVW